MAIEMSGAPELTWWLRSARLIGYDHPTAQQCCILPIRHWSQGNDSGKTADPS